VSALPVIDGRDLARASAEIVAALRDPGAFYLVQPSFPAGLCDRVLNAAREFFALPSNEKAAVHIARSPHFRGYSEMHNTRDWREQVHLAPELPAVPCEPEYLRLRGPNLWPQRLGDSWRNTFLDYQLAAGELGRELLGALARGLGLPESAFLAPSDDPAYLLMKLINYHPQPDGGAPRVGVAPHCDWSWITLLLQCEVGGLQVRTPAGAWRDVPPVADTLVVNVGELVEVATGGRLRATPHRVVNHSAERPRVSVPVFINPPLSFVVEPAAEESERPGDTDHVHRVLDPAAPRVPFVFGESEWKRKGLGRWCYHSECCAPS
jgi:isopenicillin N synthase-like dioxygenase